MDDRSAAVDILLGDDDSHSHLQHEDHEHGDDDGVELEMVAAPEPHRSGMILDDDGSEAPLVAVDLGPAPAAAVASLSSSMSSDGSKPKNKKDGKDKKAKKKAKDKKKKGGSLGWWAAVRWIGGQVLPASWRLRLATVSALALLLVAQVCTVSIPATYKHLIDSATSDAWKWLTAYVLLRWVASAIGDVRDRLFLPVANHITLDTTVKAFTHLHEMDIEYHIMRETGAVLRTIDKGIDAVPLLLDLMLFSILPTILEAVFVCGVLLFAFGALYSLVVSIAVVVYVVWTIIITEWQRAVRKSVNEKDNVSNNIALDSLLNFEAVKLFGKAQYEADRYHRSLASYLDMTTRNQDTALILVVGQGTIVAVCLAITMVMALWQLNDGSSNTSIGDLVAINAYVLQLWAPLSSLAKSYRGLQRALLNLEQVWDMTNAVPTIRDRPDARPLRVRGGTVEFKNVTFAYRTRVSKRNGHMSVDEDEDEPKPILRDLTFTVPGGTTLAIVGPSGGGKSTVLKLLCRYYDLDSGQICVDGMPIDSVTQSSLLATIGVVPQDTVLFSDTVRANIAYGAPYESVITQGDIQRAIREAQLEAFVDSQPDGLDSDVGERGLQLSGGERQRVAIARTVLKDPKILLLDEATSSLDSTTEREIQKSLAKVSRGRTTIIVAHRLATVVGADNILVLRDGRNVEEGTHEELLAANGEYARLWHMQQQSSHEG